MAWSTIGLSLVLAAALLISACARAPVPAPAPAPAPAPTVTVTAPAPTATAPAPTVTVTAPAPTPTPTPTPTAEMKPVTWQFGTYTGPFGITGATFKFFAERLEKLTNGLFKINFHWSGSLLGARDTPLGLRTGLADLGYLSTSENPDKFPLRALIEIPMVGPYFGPQSVKAQWIPLINAYAEHPLVRDELARWNLVPDLTVTIVYSPVTIVGTGPINKAADLKGVKFGGSMSLAPFMTKAGTVFVNVPWGEGYSAIQNGLVQFTSEFASSVASTKIYEVAPYATMTNISYGGAGPLVINQKSYDALPSGMKAALKQAIQEANVFAADEGVKIETAGIETIKKNYKNVILFPDGERDKLAATAAELWQEWAKDVTRLGYPGDVLVKYMTEKRNVFLGK
ncbi:MAG: TRAP transporter substrate-binding protein DctP [Chloroflexi bacterium]|nr:TRAP transporter substrate-binding protein DctP [Chloroflexota bacterium]